MEYSTGHIDYLARTFLDDFQGVFRTAIGPRDLASPDWGRLRLLRLLEVGRSRRAVEEHLPERGPIRYRSEDLLVGCAGLRTPLLFALLGNSIGLRVVVGTFPGAHCVPDGQPPRGLETVLALVAGHYPGSRLEDLSGADFQSEIASRLAKGRLGILTGLPTRKAATDDGESTQLDRVIRALQGQSWAWVVLAEPLSGNLAQKLLHSTINEMRNVENAEQVKARRGPLAETYLRHLEALLEQYEEAVALGAWAANAFYLAKEAAAFEALGSALCSAMGGEESHPDAVRAVELAEPGPLRSALGSVLLGTAQPPGDFEHPYCFQTILSSRRLAALVHLPRLEAPGFAIREHRHFDVALPEAAAKGPVQLGRIIELGQELAQDYRLSFNALNKHTLIVGVTGSGKTNTTFHLLRQLWAQGVPFLVLEPAKTEYRSLAADPTIGPDLQVFTLGEERISPFRINPFEVEQGASLSTHIDLLKATFNASFAMWSPLPQVLERCIHEIYRDLGWDPIRGVNRRLPEDARDATRALAFPTLTDLTAKVEEVVDGLGYEARVTSDIKAALMTRLESLRIGGKGAMLDTRVSIPVADLLARPTVIELEQVGDDDEKAFLMGLLLVRLYEHLRGGAHDADPRLGHVVVVEEAHRLLANVPMRSSEEHSNTRGKAVESFVNMLSEVRAYGEGFIVAEQIPTKLAPDVLKNTNIKVVHRTVAGDDREILAQCMNMSTENSFMLATFRPGEAAVFSEWDDRPILIRAPYAKIDTPPEASRKPGSDAWVRRHMEGARFRRGRDALFLPFPDCRETCGQPYAYCELSCRLLSERPFREIAAALVLTAAVEDGDLFVPLNRLKRHVLARASGDMHASDALPCVLRHVIRWYFDAFGRKYSWPLSDVAELIRLLTSAVTSAARDNADEPALADFRRLYGRLGVRSEDPYPVCRLACPSQRCLFRHQAAMLLGDGQLTEVFDVGMAAALGKDGWTDHRALERVEERLAGPSALPAEASRSLTLCYAQQQIAHKPGLLDAARTLAIDTLVAGYDKIAWAGVRGARRDSVESVGGAR